jgi:hypothetical protein
MQGKFITFNKNDYFNYLLLIRMEHHYDEIL